MEKLETETILNIFQKEIEAKSVLATTEVQGILIDSIEVLKDFMTRNNLVFFHLSDEDIKNIKDMQEKANAPPEEETTKDVLKDAPAEIDQDEVEDEAIDAAKIKNIEEPLVKEVDEIVPQEPDDSKLAEETKSEHDVPLDPLDIREKPLNTKPSTKDSIEVTTQPEDTTEVEAEQEPIEPEEKDATEGLIDAIRE